MYELTKAAQALSDETRLRIMNLILTRESCVCEVMHVLGISQTRASRNLKILYDAGFLSQRSDGLFTLYSLKTSERFFSDLVAAVKKEMRGNPIARRDLERLAQTSRGEVCGAKKTPARALPAV
jgi:ArsR family transcriptional regulator